MVNNFQCFECTKGSVCKWKDLLLKLDNDKIQVEVTVDSCEQYALLEEK